jgi:hypothetical protein
MTRLARRCSSHEQTEVTGALRPVPLAKGLSQFVMVLWSRPKPIGANGEKESEVGELLSDAGQ